MSVSIVKADAIEFLRSLPPDSVDLVFGSPPYEQARLYLENGVNLGVSRKTDAWVPWMVEVYKAAQVACKGLSTATLKRWRGGKRTGNGGPAKKMPSRMSGNRARKWRKDLIIRAAKGRPR